MSEEEIEQRRERPARFWDWFDAPDFSRWFEGVRPWFPGEERIRIEEKLSDDEMVIRAEIPGIDPDKDVEITVNNGVLRIRAERRYEKKDRTRSEFRYGSFERAITVPRDVKPDDIHAIYKDGILEVSVPHKETTEEPPKKIAISRS